MAIRNAAYPVTAATFLDKVDHVSPVVAADVNALQDELVATHIFVGVVGDLPPAGTASTATIGVTPGGREVLPHVTSHIHMLNEWVKQLRDDAGATDPVAVDALAKAALAKAKAKAAQDLANAAQGSAGLAQSTADSAQNAASSAQSTANSAQSIASAAKVSADASNKRLDDIYTWSNALGPYYYLIKYSLSGGRVFKAGEHIFIHVTSLKKVVSNAPLGFIPDVILTSWGGSGGAFDMSYYTYNFKTNSFSIGMTVNHGFTVKTGGRTYGLACMVYHPGLRGTGGVAQGAISGAGLSPTTLAALTGRPPTTQPPADDIEVTTFAGEGTGSPDDNGVINVDIPASSASLTKTAVPTP